MSTEWCTISAPNPRRPLSGNKLKHIILIGLLFSQVLLFGQEIRKIDGQRYQVHTVEKGHTLFAISKKYSIEIDQILKHNPEARSGLKIGEEILIPLGEVDKKAARDNPPEMKGQFLHHTVEKKETLYSISKKHGVEINRILEHNPGVDKKLSIGDTLKIFVGDVAVENPEMVVPAEPDSMVMHKVEPQQTLYSIARLYNVSIDSIKTVNEGLPEGLKAGSYIRIPRYTDQYLLTHKDTTGRNWQFKELSGRKQRYHVALMLPFSLDVQDSLSARGDPTKSLQLYTLTRISTEIYQGALLAIDSLVEQGLNIDLHVYDVSDDLIALDDLLKKKELNDMHLIIGPLHRESFKQVSKFARPLGIRVVSPVPNQKLQPEYPGSCVVHTNAIEQMRFLGSYIARMHFTDNVVLVDSDKFKDYDYVQAFLGAYQGQFRYGDTLRAVKLSEYGIENVKKNLSPNRRNIVVVPSSDLGFVSDFMNRLSNLRNGEYDITVFGMEKWLDYHNVDTQYKNRFGVTVPSSTYLNFDLPKSTELIRAYRKEYNTDPSSEGYAFLGFDVAYYFLNGLLHHGLDFQEYFYREKYEGVHLGFDFVQRDNGCFNRHIYLLKYEDFDLKKIN